MTGEESKRMRTARHRRPRARPPLILAATLGGFLIAFGIAFLAVTLGSGSPARPVPVALFPYNRLYTLPDADLYGSVARLRANGQSAEAAALTTIARTPAGIWAVGQPGEMSEVRSVTRAANREHAVPVIVAYNVPDRDACGKFSASSGPGPAGYRQWIYQLAVSIGTGTDIVIVEPDALPDIVAGCLNPAASAERYQLLSYAMSTLGRLPHARVYLDAGNPGMFANPARLDTSRNGNGPYTGPDNPQWCNPPGRAPGPAPRINPGPAGIDAYLWVKDPGASDGPCNGGPAAGQYFPGYALQLAQAEGHGTD